MSIVTQRHKFLDNDTNVGTMDLRSMSDNSSYNAAANHPSAISVTEKGIKVSPLASVRKRINRVTTGVDSMPDKIVKASAKALDSSVDRLMKLPLSPFASCVLKELTGLDVNGVRDFLKGAINGGSMFVCNNLDMLKDMVDGLKLNKNIFEGLILGLSLDWLDKFCKPYGQDEWLNSTNRDLLSLTYCAGFLSPGKDDLIKMFCKTASDMFDKLDGPYIPSNPPPEEIVDLIINNNWKVTEEMEFSNEEKRNYTETIGTSLVNYSDNYELQGKLLKARGDISTAPSVSRSRRKKSVKTSNVEQAFGDVLKSLKDFDLNTVSTYQLDDDQKKLLSNLWTIQELTSEDTDLHTRGSKKGDMEGYNFRPVLDEIDRDALERSRCKEGTMTRAHDDLGLHPTTSIFIGKGSKVSKLDTKKMLPGSTRQLKNKVSEASKGGGKKYLKKASKRLVKAYF